MRWTRHEIVNQSHAQVEGKGTISSPHFERNRPCSFNVEHRRPGSWDNGEADVPSRYKKKKNTLNYSTTNNLVFLQQKSFQRGYRYVITTQSSPHRLRQHSYLEDFLLAGGSQSQQMLGTVGEDQSPGERLDYLDPDVDPACFASQPVKLSFRA
jgi:hypothetical protein